MNKLEKILLIFGGIIASIMFILFFVGYAFDIQTEKYLFVFKAFLSLTLLMISLGVTYTLVKIIILESK